MNRNNYLALVPAKESKDTKKYEKLWKKIRYANRSLVDKADIMMKNI